MGSPWRVFHRAEWSFLSNVLRRPMGTLSVRTHAVVVEHAESQALPPSREMSFPVSWALDRPAGEASQATLRPGRLESQCPLSGRHCRRWPDPEEVTQTKGQTKLGPPAALPQAPHRFLPTQVIHKFKVIRRHEQAGFARALSGRYCNSVTERAICTHRQTRLMGIPIPGRVSK